MTFPTYTIPANWLRVCADYHAYAYGDTAGVPYNFTGDISDNSEGAWNGVVWLNAYDKPTYAFLSDSAFKQEALSAMGNFLSIYNQLSDHAQIGSTASDVSSLSGSLSSLASTVSGQGTNKVDKVTGKALSTEDYTSGDKAKVASMSAQSHISDGATNAATNAPTSLNVVTTLLGSLTGEVNASNTRQNDLATKYNDLATKFNTLLDKMEALTLIAAS